MTRLRKNYINFTPATIHFGQSIAMFFLSREFSDVILEYDYKNKSLIIEGMNEEKFKSYKYPIAGTISIQTIRVCNKKNATYGWRFIVTNRAHRSLLDFSRRELNFSE